MQTKVSNEFLARNFLEVIPSAMRAIRSELRQMARTDLTVPQFRILAMIAREKQTTNRELAEQMGNTPPCTSRMVESLVKQGMIRRVPSAQDRRQVHLQLTPKGQAKFKAIKTRAQTCFSHQFEKLSPESKAALQQGFIIIGQLFDMPDLSPGILSRVSRKIRSELPLKTQKCATYGEKPL